GSRFGGRSTPFEWFNRWRWRRDALTVAWQCGLTASSSAVLTYLALLTSRGWGARRYKALAAQAFGEDGGSRLFRCALPPAREEGVREGRPPVCPPSSLMLPQPGISLRRGPGRYTAALRFFPITGKRGEKV